MHLIVYLSDYTGQQSNISDELTDIVSKSKQNNPQQQITGALFYHQGKFLQLLEGEKQQLETLMTRLGTDKRHDNIVRLIDEPIETRKLPNWNMDFLDLDKDIAVNQNDLQFLTDIYKQNLVVNTDTVLHFYKEMLKNRSVFKE